MIVQKFFALSSATLRSSMGPLSKLVRASTKAA